MSNDYSSAFNHDLPSPEGLQELIDSLKKACSEVGSARQQLQKDYQVQLVNLRDGATRSIEKAITGFEGEQGKWRKEVEREGQTLQKLRQQATELSGDLKQNLAMGQDLQRMHESRLKELTSEVSQVLAERERWEAAGKMSEARHEAAMQELRRALDHDRKRMVAMEADNRLLAQAIARVEDRLLALERDRARIKTLEEDNQRLNRATTEFEDRISTLEKKKFLGMF